MSAASDFVAQELRRASVGRLVNAIRCIGQLRTSLVGLRNEK